MIELIQVRTLELYPSQAADIHPSFDSTGRDAWLYNDIKNFGVLAPLFIRENKQIVDGRRRWECAKAIDIEALPCILVADMHASRVWASTRIQQGLTVYAACVLYRYRLEELMSQQAGRDLGLYPLGRGECAHPLDEAWTSTELATGIPRVQLKAGMRLLSAVEKVRQIDEGVANRILYIFRTHGLTAAQRMLDWGETEGYALDCADWEPGTRPVPEYWQNRVKDCLARIRTILDETSHLTPAVRGALTTIANQV